MNRLFTFFVQSLAVLTAAAGATWVERIMLSAFRRAITSDLFSVTTDDSFPENVVHYAKVVMVELLIKTVSDPYDMAVFVGWITSLAVSFLFAMASIHEVSINMSIGGSKWKTLPNLAGAQLCVLAPTLLYAAYLHLPEDNILCWLLSLASGYILVLLVLLSLYLCTIPTCASVLLLVISHALGLHMTFVLNIICIGFVSRSRQYDLQLFRKT